jgi:hypothetical protein
MSVRLSMLCLFLAALMFGAMSCKAECEEKCKKDDDCIAAHACFQFANNKDKICAPVACKGCQDVCAFQINPNADAVQGCTFVSCDNGPIASFPQPAIAAH